MVLLQPGHLLCGNDNVDDLDDFGGLDADSGETDPAVVAGAAVRTEEDQGDQQNEVDAAEQLPLFGKQVRVDKGQQNKCTQAEKQREDLDNDALDGAVHPAGGLHGDRGDPDHIDPEQGTDQAHDQQEDIRPFKKHMSINFELFDCAAPPSGELTFRIRYVETCYFIMEAGNLQVIRRNVHKLCKTKERIVFQIRMCYFYPGLSRSGA